jgi:hypothetical protein
LGSFEKYYYDGFHEAGEGVSMPVGGVYNLDKIKKWSKPRSWCPYYLIRRAINRQPRRGRRGYLAVKGISGNRFIHW